MRFSEWKPLWSPSDGDGARVDFYLTGEMTVKSRVPGL
jgi:hypothetical protein